MSLSRITTRFSRTLMINCGRSRSLLLVDRQGRNYASSLSNKLIRPHDKVVSGHVSFLHHSASNPSAFQWFGFSSSTSPQVNEDPAQSRSEQENKTDTEAAASANNVPDLTDVPVSDGNSEPGSSMKSSSNISEAAKRRRKGTKRVAFSDSDSDSDSDSESDLSRDDLVKIVMEKEQLLVTKQEEFEKMKDKVLRTFAEMENVKDRTRRESENAKKFAIQNFAKSLLDVADNLGRASSAAKESFSKIDASTDTTGAVQQLKVLLDGVEMTEKQLTEVFKKFGVEKYDPTGEEFDPNRHNAVFQVPDASKPADRVAIVLKAGYILHDRVIRPAEVGVTVALNGE